jgi:hypothetical protein
MWSPTVSRSILLCLVLLVAISAAGCAAVAGIFKAGMWVGVIIAAIFVIGALALISRFR